MKRVLLFLFFFVVLLVAGIAALPFVVSPGFVGEKLQAAIRENTGRTLTITSAPRISFWPELAVELDGARLSNPPGMFDGQIAQMDKLRLRVAAAPLLSRRLEIKELTLERPRISLVVDSQGRANWNFDQAATGGKTDAGGKSDSGDGQDSAAGAPALESIKLAPIVIKDGDIRYLDERTGGRFAAKNVNLTVSMPSLDSPLDAKGRMVWNEQPVNLVIYVKTPARFAGEGTALDLAVSAPLLDMTFNGRAAVRGGFNLAGQVETKTRSIRDLAKWTGTPLAPGGGLGVFSARGVLDLQASEIELKKATISLDGMRAQGDVKIALAGSRPMVTASLGLDQLNLNVYTPNARPAGAGGSGEGAISRGWSDKHIDLAGLKAVDAKLSLNAGQITYGDVKIGRTEIAANLQNGVLNADLKKMAFYGGNAAGRIILNGSRGKPSLQGALNAKGLDGFKLLNDFAKFRRISGTANLTLSIASVGVSQREMISTLRGKGNFRFTDGAIRGVNVARMIRNVDKAILGGWDSGPSEQTDFSVLQASYTIKDGIADNRDLKMLGPLVRVTGAGNVDMLRQALDYKVVPKLVASLQGQGGNDDLTGLPVPVIIKGPWAKPKIYPDIEGILQNPQAAFDALSKITGQNLNIEGAGAGLQDTAEKAIEKVIKKDATKVLGEDADKIIGDQGKKLLKGLFGD